MSRSLHGHYGRGGVRETAQSLPITKSSVNREPFTFLPFLSISRSFQGIRIVMIRNMIGCPVRYSAITMIGRSSFVLKRSSITCQVVFLVNLP